MSNQANLEKLVAKRDALTVAIKEAAVKQVHALMELHELTPADLNGKLTSKPKSGKPVIVPHTIELVSKGKPKSKAKVQLTGHKRGPQPPKYRNPETGETWSGMARPPTWIKDAKDREVFLIK